MPQCEGSIPAALGFNARPESLQMGQETAIDSICTIKRHLHVAQVPLALLAVDGVNATMVITCHATFVEANDRWLLHMILLLCSFALSATGMWPDNLDKLSKNLHCNTLHQLHASNVP